MKTPKNGMAVGGARPRRGANGQRKTPRTLGADASGKPIRDESSGERVMHRLLPKEDERAAAKKLVLREYRKNQQDEMAGFHRPVRYRNEGVA